ncbi:MAG: type II restriction endonuclease [Archangium sp.]|nr:type II restriction endonuclease [Archangium sp.]MDP3570697.1 type II restriction endonuclease [Archangium sp.]
MLFAAKRLSAVEVAIPGRRKGGETNSNQHEFNAGRLRKALGLGSRVSGELRLLFFLDDGVEPVADEAPYSLYDARKGKPRSAEYRLYYRSTRVSELAKAGDLLVVFRPTKSNELFGVIAREGTSTERALLEALELDPVKAMKQFVFREAASLSKSGLNALARAPHLALDARESAQHPLLLRALATGLIPPAHAIAKAAHDSVVARFGDIDPDPFITASVDEESALYFSIESAVKEKQLQFLISTGQATLPTILKFTLSIQQSRKARRGHSLQFHCEALLRDHRIPFTPQCKTENGETPDIVVPGKKQYSNKNFPAELLRMVACKSTVRERWGQVTREAKRIEEKYLLTLDDSMSPEVITNMTTNHRLIPFVPREIRDRAYGRNPLVRTVGDLVALLKLAVEEARSRGHLKPRD